jgi:hypothetical protein
LAHEGTVSAAAAEAAPFAPSEIGERIAAILDAAEASAERIRSDARNEAAQILREAHERAARRALELTAEPERLRDEAARAAVATRSQADADAGRLVSAAQADADALRRAARDDVRRIEDEVRELERVRDGALENVRAVIAGMRSAADRLEQHELAGAAVRPEESAEDSGGGLGRLLRRMRATVQFEESIRVGQTPNGEPL